MGTGDGDEGGKGGVEWMNDLWVEISEPRSVDMGKGEKAMFIKETDGKIELVSEQIIGLSKEIFKESQRRKWLRHYETCVFSVGSSTASQIHTHSDSLTADYPADYLEQIFALGPDRHPPHTQCRYQFDRDKKKCISSNQPVSAELHNSVLCRTKKNIPGPGPRTGEVGSSIR